MIFDWCTRTVHLCSLRTRLDQNKDSESNIHITSHQYIFAAQVKYRYKKSENGHDLKFICVLFLFRSHYVYRECIYHFIIQQFIILQQIIHTQIYIECVHSKPQWHLVKIYTTSRSIMNIMENIILCILLSLYFEYMFLL